MTTRSPGPESARNLGKFRDLASIQSSSQEGDAPLPRDTLYMVFTEVWRVEADRKTGEPSPHDFTYYRPNALDLSGYP